MTCSAAGPAMDPQDALSVRGLARSTVCLACGFDVRGIERAARCPECGQSRADSGGACMIGIRRVLRGAALVRWTIAGLLALGALWLVGLAVVRVADDGVLLAGFLLIFTIVCAPLVPCVVGMGVWEMARPLLALRTEGRWRSWATRACGVLAMPMLVLSWLAQFGSAAVGMAIAAVGVLAACGAAWGLRAQRLELCDLLGAPSAMKPRGYGIALSIGVVLLGLSVPAALVWAATVGGVSAVAVVLPPMAIAAWLVGLKCSGHAIRRTLRAACVGGS